MPPHVLKTDQLLLRDFRVDDLAHFAALHAEPRSMHDLGGPISCYEDFYKLDSYIAARRKFGYSRWAVFHDQVFAGYVGITHHEDVRHPLGRHDDIGWRLLPEFWGNGIAVKAARLVLQDAQTRLGLDNIFAYTQATNSASRAVIRQLGLIRDESLDFSEPYPPTGQWHGLVWRVPNGI